MNIAIDLTATPKNKTGIGRYMLGLLVGLQRQSDDNEYYLFLHNDDLDGFAITNERFHLVPVHSRILRHTWIRVLWEQFVFPWRLRKKKIDVLHCPNFTMPYLIRLISRRTAVVGTFHDMTYFFLPEYHVAWKRELFKMYIKLTSRWADQLITISQNSKKDIPRYCKPKNKEIAVTYMGVEQAFFSHEKPAPSLLSSFGIEGEYILYIGTLEPRKNVPGLIKAYSLLDEETIAKTQLVICGKKGWLFDEIFASIPADLVTRNRIIFTGYVNDEEMVPLLAGASTFAYVSFYEGFGIPVIEGLASGVPTVTSKGSSLEEVAGEYTFVSDPNQPEDIRNKLIAALSLTPKEREERAKKGVEHARQFSWDACAEATIRAYEDAMEAKKK